MLFCIEDLRWKHTLSSLSIWFFELEHVVYLFVGMVACQYLNSHPVLYKAVVGVEESPDILTTEEARRAAKTLRMDFERGGIHLPSGKLLRT
jgi:hypothetical protein